jgi:hypothetical protein
LLLFCTSLGSALPGDSAELQAAAVNATKPKPTIREAVRAVTGPCLVRAIFNTPLHLIPDPRAFNRRLPRAINK